MSELVPRWEWRSFGRHFGRAEERLNERVPEGVQESDEIYLISPALNNVKIRDSLLDIKMKRDVNADGLEQWIPVLKAGFPLSTDVATKLFDALDLPVPDDLRNGCALEELLRCLATPGSKVRVAKVHKRRTRYSVDGCMAEFTDIEAEGKHTRTVAVESADAAGVMRAVTGLGLRDYLNTSYPSGLVALLEDQPERYAVIDVGTNSVKFHIGERSAGGSWRAFADRAEVTRLGEGLAESGVIDDEALDRTAGAVAGMSVEAKNAGVRAIAAVGTAGLRIAGNATQAIAAIKAKSGVLIEIISGEEESRLAFVAARAGLGPKAGSLVVFDTGGGSSQFTFGHDSSVDQRFSVDVGAVLYTERFGLDGVVTTTVVDAAMEAISADLSSLKGRAVPDLLVGMGGAVTNITAVKHGLTTYDPRVVQGTLLDSVEVDRQIDLYRSLDADARRAIVGLQPKRAEVILAGACIVRTIMKMLGKDSLTVSDRGLRHGVLAERFACGDERHSSVPKSASPTVKKARQPREEKKVMDKAEAKRQPESHEPTFSSEDVTKILELIKGSKSVELKLTVPDKDRRAAVEGLGFDPVESQPRQAYFFDTPDLALNKAGIVVRARRIQGGDGDTVIKLRPIDPAVIDKDLRRSDSFKIELDAMPGGYVCSASFKGSCYSRRRARSGGRQGNSVITVLQGAASLLQETCAG